MAIEGVTTREDIQSAEGESVGTLHPPSATLGKTLRLRVGQSVSWLQLLGLPRQLTDRFPLSSASAPSPPPLLSIPSANVLF